MRCSVACKAAHPSKKDMSHTSLFCGLQSHTSPEKREKWLSLEAALLLPNSAISP